ncbi:TPA: hypothetical protein ACSPMB_003855, partial [Pseudomonas aeruginosa]
PASAGFFLPEFTIEEDLHNYEMSDASPKKTDPAGHKTHDQKRDPMAPIPTSGFDWLHEPYPASLLRCSSARAPAFSHRYRDVSHTDSDPR